MIRKCKKCNEEKCITLFVKKKYKNGKRYYLFSCIECNKKYTKQYCNSYYQANKAKIIQKSKDWYKSNLNHKKEYDKKYVKDNSLNKKEYDKEYRKLFKLKINKRTLEYIKNRKKIDPEYKLRKNISYSIWYYLKLSHSNKSDNSILKFLQFSIKELKIHLENQFESWMNWNNYGLFNINRWNDNNQSTWTWQIDHIIPQSKLPYISMEEDNFKKCWSLSNLRPYSSKQNLLDGNKR